MAVFLLLRLFLNEMAMLFDCSFSIIDRFCVASSKKTTTTTATAATTATTTTTTFFFSFVALRGSALFFFFFFLLYQQKKMGINKIGTKAQQERAPSVNDDVDDVGVGVGLERRPPDGRRERRNGPRRRRRRRRRRLPRSADRRRRRFCSGRRAVPSGRTRSVSVDVVSVVDVLFVCVCVRACVCVCVCLCVRPCALAFSAFGLADRSLRFRVGWWVFLFVFFLTRRRSVRACVGPATR